MPGRHLMPNVLLPVFLQTKGIRAIHRKISHMEDGMRKKSHISLAKYIVDSIEEQELVKHRKAFYLGSILPDCKPSFITVKHEMEGTFPKVQQELEEKIYEAAAGGGVVTASVTGKRELQSLKIDPDAVDPDDVELLEDMIVAAVNEALRAAENDAAGTMQKLTGGLNLPF